MVITLFLYVFIITIKKGVPLIRLPLLKRFYSIPSLNLSDLSVFFISMVMVMGPTPPGTGVIDPAISFAASKSTSPFRIAIVFPV